MTAMTVIAAMLPLLQSVHLSYSSLSEACRYLPDGRLLALFRCPFCSLSIPCGFVCRLTGTRSYEPSKHDTPRRESCCHARVISILSSPVWLAWWPSLWTDTFAALSALALHLCCSRRPGVNPFENCTVRPPGWGRLPSLHPWRTL